MLCIGYYHYKNSDANRQGSCDIKKIALKYIQEELDNSFMVWDKDEEMLEFFKQPGIYEVSFFFLGILVYKLLNYVFV